MRGFSTKEKRVGPFLMVQWLGPWTSTAQGCVLDPWLGN